MGIFEPALYRPFAIGFFAGALMVGAQIVGQASGLLG